MPSPVPDIDLFHLIAAPDMSIGKPLTELQLKSLSTVADVSQRPENIIAVYCDLTGLGRCKAGYRRMKQTLIDGLYNQSRLHQALTSGYIEQLPKGTHLFFHVIFVWITCNVHVYFMWIICKIHANLMWITCECATCCFLCALMNRHFPWRSHGTSCMFCSLLQSELSSHQQDRRQSYVRCVSRTGRR